MCDNSIKEKTMLLELLQSHFISVYLITRKIGQQNGYVKDLEYLGCTAFCIN